MVQTLSINGYSGSTAVTLAKAYAKYPWGNMTVKFVNLKNQKVTTYGIPTTLSIKKGTATITVTVTWSDGGMSWKKLIKPK